MQADLSPSGAQVVTRSFGGEARLWDTRSGAELAVFSGHLAPDGLGARDRGHATFSPDGTRLVTVSGHKMARVFRVFPTTQGLIDHARTGVPNELSACERKRFFLPVAGEIGDCPS